MWDYNWMGYGFGGFFMILFWAFIIIVFFRFLRGGNGYGGGCCSHDHSGHADDENKKSEAINILEQRYAKGEITKEQFEDMKKTINNK